ncbi:MAG TPA: hypothetical protein VKT83_03505 [bacterium]|nr:hypothetical protein [bacterium]
MMRRTSVERAARREIAQLTRQKDKIERRLNMLHNILIEMETYDSSEPSSSRKMGANQIAIASILRSGNGAMSVRDIANRVYQTGRIKSANGHRGIYAIVQTVLRRNAKTTFIKVGTGKWELRERYLASKGIEKGIKQYFKATRKERTEGEKTTVPAV